jgi:Asp/Glu/hydantoin racemase
LARDRFIGVLCWEEGLVPKGLRQLEDMCGNSTNPSTYKCPVVFSRIEGATTKTILDEPDPAVHERMLQTARKLCGEGAAAITTSCGFNVILQKRLSEEVRVPVFSSSLMQAPWVLSMLGGGAEVLVITAKGSALSSGHLSAAGIKDASRCHVYGLEKNSEWNKIFSSPRDEIDIGAVRLEILHTVETAILRHPKAGAIILECTDLPPFSGVIREKTGLPVFDFVTMLRWVEMSIGV